MGSVSLQALESADKRADPENDDPFREKLSAARHM